MDKEFKEFAKMAFNAYYDSEDGSVYENFLDTLTDAIIDFCHDHDFEDELDEVM